MKLTAKIFNKKTIVLTFSCLLSNVAMSANWLVLSEDDTETKSLDLDNIYQDNNGYVNFFGKSDYTKAQKADGKYYNYAMFHFVGDCSDRTLAVLGVNLYSKNGTLIESEDASSLDWQTAYPDTAGEFMLKSACAIAYLDTSYLD